MAFSEGAAGRADGGKADFAPVANQAGKDVSSHVAHFAGSWLGTWCRMNCIGYLERAEEVRILTRLSVLLVSIAVVVNLTGLLRMGVWLLLVCGLEMLTKRREEL